MLRPNTIALLFLFSIGCTGTETGNPAKPMIDASRIELVMHADSYEIIGEPGAVSEDAEITSFEVWASAPPLRSQVMPSTGFSFEFFGSAPPFRVYAENETGRSEMLTLGSEQISQNFSCFGYTGAYEIDLGTVPAPAGEVELITLSFSNMCDTEATIPDVRLRLREEGLTLRGATDPTPAGASAMITIVADTSVTDFANILLVGDRSVPSIAIRGQVRR